MKNTALKGAAGAVIILVLLEVALRLFLGLGSPLLLQKDPEIGYLFEANQETYRFGNRIHVNRYHQRSPDISEKRGRRILFIGDSVTWGGSLTDQEHTYPERFRAAYESRCDTDIDVLNASAGSWGIPNQMAYLSHFGTFESDLVIFQIGAHDLLQPASQSYMVECHPSYPGTAPAFAIEELFSRYIGPRWLGIEANCDPKEKRDLRTDEEHFEQNMSSFKQTVQQVRNESGRVVVLHTPERSDLKSGFYPNQWQNRFYRITDSLSVEVIDLHQEWDSEPDVEDWYRDNIHINEKGNEQLARTLLNELVNSSYLSCSTQDDERNASRSQSLRTE